MAVISGPHLQPQLGVEVRERLIHQEGSGLSNERPSHGDTLALTADNWPGRRCRRSSRRRMRAVSRTRRIEVCLWDSLNTQWVGDVAVHGHVGVERVVLEDHRNVALRWFEFVDALTVDSEFAAGDVLESCHHAKGRGLAAARGGPRRP